MKRSETRQRKSEALEVVFGNIRNRATTVKLIDLYAFVGDVWNTPAYFVQDALKNIPKDMKVKTSKKGGTFIEVDTTNFPNITIREAVMGGLFPSRFVGLTTTVRPTKEMTKLKKVPKMFNKFSDTVEVYRVDRVGKPSKYLQVTPTERFMFTQSA